MDNSQTRRSFHLAHSCAHCLNARAVVDVADHRGTTAELCGRCWDRLRRYLPTAQVVALVPAQRSSNP